MELPLDLISTVYGRHPARVLPFEELYEGLQRAVLEGDVAVMREAGLEQYIYTNRCRFENRWNLFSLLARGLILDPNAARVVATPFPKFFNFGELGLALPNEAFEVTEKIDGSLGIVFYHGDGWQVATKGRLTSEQALWATAYLAANVAAHCLVPGTTYLVEIVYPQNRIVVPYDFEALFLLGGFDEQGNELSRNALDDVAAASGLRPVPSHSYESFDQLIEVARALPRDREGFVVRFRGGLRLKLKGEQYCQIHRLISYCTPLALWEAMMDLRDINQIRQDLPEEMLRDFDIIARLLQARLDDLVGEVRAGVVRTAGLSDKQVGILIQDAASELSAVQRKFLFMARKGRFFEWVGQPGESRRKAFMCFRPDRNDLPGYDPSGAMNRFQTESS